MPVLVAFFWVLMVLIMPVEGMAVERQSSVEVIGAEVGAKYAQNRQRKQRKLRKKRRNRKHVRQGPQSKPSVASSLGSSAAMRRADSMYILGEIGLVDILFAGYGLRFGMALERDTGIEASLLHSKFEFFEFEATMQFYQLNYRVFLGNSFMVYFGGGLRNLESTRVPYFFLDDTDDGSVSFSSTHLIAGGGIGNRWQWDSFTLGCDWVGYQLPLIEISSSDTAEDSVSEFNKEFYRESHEAQASSGNTMLVRFHLGFTF